MIQLRIREATKLGYAIATENDTINIQFPNSKTRRGRVQRGGAGTLETSCNQGVIVPDQRYIDNIKSEYSFVKKKMQKMLNDNGEMPEMFNAYNEAEINDLAPTITAGCGRASTSANVLKKEQGYRIRRLTPKECFRLQGVPDEVSQKLFDAGISDTQLYRAAGDAMTVNVLYEIAKSMKEVME